VKLQVKLFAAARQTAGQAVVEVELPVSPTVGQLRAALVEQYPALAEIAAHVVFAVNAEYADETAQIPSDAEVACIPPVSGG
jgi:molybdopterin synthase catalytic subunit/molybdopterin synthase sulfur carrier subunit